MILSNSRSTKGMVAEFMALTPQKLIASCSGIGTLPVVYQRLDEAINNPYSELSDIAAILSEDPSLTARLLRLANSSMFCFPSPVDTVSRAITIMGTKQLRDLVLATIVIEMFNKIPEEHVSMELFWRHSIATGIAARVIATYRREANVERFYVLGLLHDIGRLVMYLQIPEMMNRATEYAIDNNVPLHQAEQQQFGFDHAVVGKVLLDEWKLPISLQEGVAYHHRPEQVARYQEEAAIIHIADIIANAFKMGGSARVPPFVEQAWHCIGLTVEQLPLITDQLEAQYSAAVDVFLN